MSNYNLFAIKMGLVPPKEKKVNPIKKESEKRAKLNREYRKKVKKLAEIDTNCEVRSPECTGQMQGLNHLQKRSVKNLTEDWNTERSCNACNSYCERFPKWAKENGHFISRFEPSVLIANKGELNTTIIESA